MRDTDGDGRADRREVLYGVFGHRDTHGMTNAFTWGFDGWIYACHGFSNTRASRGRTTEPIAMNSGNTYRMRPDGSHAEYVTHGQVNPFGLAFDPLGNLYSCDCHSRPVYQLIRGAWYPSFGKPDDGLGFGPDMVTHDHGSTGIAGISYYAADQFPEAYRGTVFIGNVVTNRINHDRIEWHGSSPKGIEQPDFVWSEDNWFRPVDIELGPDGALYVADFYNRIIGHYEVPLTHPGRDRRAGGSGGSSTGASDGKQPPPPSPSTGRGPRSTDLVADLGHPNLAVRISAANQLVERGRQRTSTRRSARSWTTASRQRRRVHGLWVLQRRGRSTTRPCGLRRDADRELRVHGLKILSSERSCPADARARPGRHARRRPIRPPGRRRGAGAHPSLANIRPLLALRQATPADDTHLIHVARIALRDQLKTADVWQGLETLGLSERDRRDIADVATGVHSPEAAAFLLGYLRDHRREPRELAPLRPPHRALRGARPDRQPGRLVKAAGPHGRRMQARLLKAIHQGLQERGMPPAAAMHAMAVEHARALLARRMPARSTWVSSWPAG